MCITLLSTAHPAYPFILLNNRDEFLNRPTAQAQWWDSPYGHVLGGRDLHRQERGTWLGITKQGRIANLTNYREEGVEVMGSKSRGGLIKAYLAPPESGWTDETFVKHLIDDVGIHDVGGCTLLFGELRALRTDGSLPGLSAVSNRTSNAGDVTKIGTRLLETHGLSNSHYENSATADSWPKVVTGERLLSEAIESNLKTGDSQEIFMNQLFDVLSVDSLPRPKQGDDFQTYTRQLRHSIFIPPVGGSAIESKTADEVAAADDYADVKLGEGVYGTHQQTVILVNVEGHVTFVERTLYDTRGRADQRDRKFDFQIEGWKQ
ncbi:hypothetical protein LTR08_001319 [Meristemomyces frigidus]|nr:hypothetical protein LTR08_001319 [Meristemomyces frigidus]